MRQIISAVRCLSIALVLVAAFTTLSTAQQAAARYSRADLEYVCVAQGGIYFESHGINGTISYGCWYPEGDEDVCYHFAGDPTPFCFYFPAEPKDNVGDPVPNSSQPAGGEVVDRYS